MRDVVVRAQELVGRWVSLGSDAARGITVQGLTADADAAGPRACSFTLRRRTDVPWPDIGALAPLEIESQGGVVWSGRVKGTPTSDGSDRSITVNGEGWQYHLDDDPYKRSYISTKLADWKDHRTLNAATLAAANLCANGQVSQGAGGSIILAFPATSDVYAGSQVGVVFDAGPGQTMARWLIGIQTSNNASGIDFRMAESDVEPPTLGSNLLFSQTISLWGAQGFQSVAVASTSRYLLAYIVATGAATLGTDDVWVRILYNQVFADSAYESGGASVLTASAIVLDAQSRGTLLLSPDTSKVQATSFAIPEFAMSAPNTPREVMTAANAFHDWQLRVRADLLLEYRPLPADPIIQVDARSTFDEASSGDASEIYSGVMVSYTDASGAPQVVARAQPATIYTLSSIQPSNPGAETNTTGWTGSSLSRTTTAGQFTTGVAGFKATYATSAAWSAGSWIPGAAYRLTLAVRNDTVTGLGGLVELRNSATADLLATASMSGDGTFHALTLDWVQKDAFAPRINLIGSISTTFIYFDNLLLYEAAPTIVNRRGFRRTKILDTQMALTTEAAQQVGDIFLAGHKNTPLKGKLVISGYGTASVAQSGQRMAPAELLLNGGELVRFMHLIDPDTGALGREGRIASVSWDAESDTVTIEIDSQVTNFEALVQRLAVLTSQVG